MFYRLTLALAAAAILPTALMAGPLNPEQVPADAKWLAHVDLAALDETKALKEVRGIWPQRTEKLRSWMQENYGIDPREDFESVTLYGTGYAKGDCVLILTADYSEDKVRSLIQSQQDVKKTEWRDHTIYTCKAGDKKSDDGQDSSAKNKGWGDGESKKVAWVLVDDDTIVYAKSPRGVKDAVETIEGHVASLEGKDSKLTSDLPHGAVAYAAAERLDSIPHDGLMFPVLRQLEHGCYALGERDGKLFDELKLVARNEEVASQLKQVIDGYAALCKVSVSDSKPLSKMMDNVQVQQNGATVKASWNGDVDRFAQALRNLKSVRQR